MLRLGLKRINRIERVRDDLVTSMGTGIML
jgi:hypothetical protein